MDSPEGAPSRWVWRFRSRSWPWRMRVKRPPNALRRRETKLASRRLTAITARRTGVVASITIDRCSGQGRTGQKDTVFLRETRTAEPAVVRPEETRRVVEAE